jgi:hypothetical protein
MRHDYSRRAMEWTLMLIVILAVMGYFFREFRMVQAQGELAAVKTTLGSLRTSLLFDFLKRQAERTDAAVPMQRNPFLLLDHLPGNYSGALASAKGQVMQPGSWVFDSYCNCIGYEPQYPYGMSTPEDARAIWFRISPPPGPLQINPMQNYQWAGQLVD